MRIEEKEGRLTVVDFNEIDAYKIASKVEKDGIEFYQELLKKLGTEDEKCKKIISFLIDEERAHLKFFEESLFRLRQKSPEFADNDEEDILYSMDYGIFKGIAHEPHQALKSAIAIEDKSIKFYECCKGHVQAAQAKQELQVIIDEEMKHREVLLDMLNHL